MDEGIRYSNLHRDKLSLIETILPGIAHEINNKNQTILLTVQIVLEVWEGLRSITDRYFAEHGNFTAGGLEYSLIRKELAGYCNNMLESTRSIDRIVSEIRSFSKSDPLSGFRSFDLNRLVERAVTLLANPLHKATDHLNLVLDPTLPSIQGNREHIVQLLLHLILIACRSISEKKASLTISTRHDKDRSVVECVIQDQGRGLQADEVSQILGYLAGDIPYPEKISDDWQAVRSIVTEHNGFVDLQSRAEHGTRVMLAFPVQANRS
jgi:signal transduction histidine kinase